MNCYGATVQISLGEILKLWYQYHQTLLIMEGFVTVLLILSRAMILRSWSWIPAAHRLCIGITVSDDHHSNAECGYLHTLYLLVNTSIPACGFLRLKFTFIFNFVPCI